MLPSAVSATPEHPRGARSLSFYANDAHDDLVSVTVAGNRAKTAVLVTEPSPSWWRPYYLTPSSVSGTWVVGTFGGDQADTTDDSRLFAVDTATRRIHWLTVWGTANRSPAAGAGRVPQVYYLRGGTVRAVTATGGEDHQVFRAPAGWKITALTASGTAAPYVALTRNPGPTPLTATTQVEQLTRPVMPVLPVEPGSITALASSPDTRTLAVSTVEPAGQSVLRLRPVERGGLRATLPDVGETRQVSWDGTGSTLAVDPLPWGGTTLVDVRTGRTSYPPSLQRFGAEVLAPVPVGRG